MDTAFLTIQDRFQKCGGCIFECKNKFVSFTAYANMLVIERLKIPLKNMKTEKRVNLSNISLISS